MSQKQMPKGIFILFVVAAIVVAGLLIFSYARKHPATTNQTTTTSAVTPASTISAASQKDLLALAQALTKSGAKFYGAYWCGHCKNQKAEFGTAVSALPYVECDASGPNANAAACDAAGVTGYPTWVIGGKQYVGEQSIDQLKSYINFKS